MTAKEKADSLVSLFLWPQRKFNQPAMISVARERAFISVQQTIETLTEYGRESNELQNMDREMAFWDEVLTEIKPVKLLSNKS